MIRILLVDDHASSREPLATLLDLEPDMAVVAQAGSIEDAKAKMQDIDVAVVDLGLPDGNGADFVECFCGAHPNAFALVLTGNIDINDRARAIEAGASGVLSKSAPFEQVLSSVRKVFEGEPIHSPEEMVVMLRTLSRHRVLELKSSRQIASLTPRELDVLQALADGLSDQEISERLNVAAKTVRAHMTNILGKLELSSRLQVLLFAMRHGLVTLK